MIKSWSRNKKIIFVISIFTLLASLVLLLPIVRTLIVRFAEIFIVQRELQKPNKWIVALHMYAVRGILASVVLLVVLMVFEKLKHAYLPIIAVLQNRNISVLKRRTLSVSPWVSWKQFVIPVAVIFGIYTLGISSIIRADFLYKDDLYRVGTGYRGWENYSRHINNLLAALIHTETQISDISPLSHLIAALFIAAASVTLVYVLNGKKISKTALAVSLPLGLSPYFLECFSYKFDSPYMALSVLVSIVPFIFMENKRAFCIISIMSLLIMCMTYQASSGIYIIIAILLCFLQWNTRQKTNREVFAFMFISTASYSITMLLFKVFFMVSFMEGYVSSSVYSLSQMIPGIIQNFTIYMEYIKNDFHRVWKVFLFLAMAAFLLKSVVTTKRNKLLALLVSFIILVVMAALSYGAYLLMPKPLYAPRGMYGFGAFIAILGIYTASPPKKMFAIPALALCWCFFVFSFVYGNALSAQKKYDDFGTEILLYDLSMLFPQYNSSLPPLPIIILGNFGHAPPVNNIGGRNPVIYRLIPAPYGWIVKASMRHRYNFNITFSWQDDSENDNGFEQILDSRYHTIKSDGERVMVFLK